ncbi:DNA-directed RNA polymerase III subunit RPC3-like [Lineus longissimus]|uniref:DNA-directed RNA polymerase III subunit RPC3-like n=1 Tax=Lineus longissimus TaxID=88925 RepID=UPI002B4E4494
MTEPLMKLVSAILKEFYGEVVEKVGSFLVRKNWTPFRVLVVETKLKPTQVKRALVVLIQQNIAKFEVQAKSNSVEYSASYRSVLHRLCYPQYVYAAKTLYGDAGELIVEEMLHYGQVTMSSCLERVSERVKDSTNGESVTSSTVREKFYVLARTHFIQRCPATVLFQIGTPAPEMALDEEMMYVVPNIDTTRLGGLKEAGQEPPAKRHKGDEFNDDKKIYWRLNFARFHQHLRDQAIISAVSNKIDKKGGEVMRTFLRINELHSINNKAAISVQIDANEVYKTIPKEFIIGRHMMEQYLVLLSSESTRFVEKIGDSGGGTYHINIKSIVSKLCEAHIESVVLERFGSKCLRIFRLLLLKKHLEQKQIEEFAMIPAKETKELLYRMFEEQFVTITEVPRTPDHAPSRTFYLFSVNMNIVVRMVLAMAYKTVYNLMVRRQHETNEHKRLLDKHQRVEAIAATLEQSGADPAQREEIEEMITPAEKSQLQKVKHMTRQLEQSEIQLIDTIFMLETYLEYTDIPKVVKPKAPAF